MKLAIYQGPHLPEAEALDTVAQVLAQSPADLVVFPELFIPGYNRPDLLRRIAQPKGGNWDQRFAAMAKDAGKGLVIGWPEREGDAIYNAATCYGRDGTTLGHYRKIQLFGPMERSVFAYGDSYCTFDFDGIRCGLLICYDIEFAQHAWAQRERGVDLLLVPTANPIAYDNVPALMVPSRAAENGMTVAYANYCGTEGDITFGGRSAVFDPDGTPLVSAGRSPAILNVEVTPQEAFSQQHADFRRVT